MQLEEARDQTKEDKRHCRRDPSEAASEFARGLVADNEAHNSTSARAMYVDHGARRISARRGLTSVDASLYDIEHR
jgi:hypothetical protein